MDGNKDEALKCLKIGKEALASGDHIRGSKFIKKAQRLDPLLNLDDLLKNLDEKNGFKNSPEFGAGTGAGGGGAKIRGGVSGLGPGSGVGTDEQVLIVREIRRKKDYYDILGIGKDCSVEDVRKAYRKLSLKVHPDKNKAQGSEEAFKKVSKAFQCLSDVESRRQYDVMGSDEVGGFSRQNTSTTRRSANQGFGNGFYYEGDVDAEEIFRNFFFGGTGPRATTQFNGFNFGNGGVRARTGSGSGNSNGMDGFDMRTLLKLLPVLVILFVSFFPSNEPVYSLSRTYSYEYKLVTQRGVPFFVKSRNFEQSYPLNSDERVQLEGRIEHDYLSILSHNCRLETNRVHWGYRPPAPNCDMLRKFEAGLVS